MKIRRIVVVVSIGVLGWVHAGETASAQNADSSDGKSLIGNAKQPGDSSYHVYTIGINGTRLRRRA